MVLIRRESIAKGRKVLFKRESGGKNVSFNETTRSELEREGG